MVSTFSEGDSAKMMQAMRLLPYDRLVLVGGRGLESTEDFAMVDKLESMAGEKVGYAEVETSDFLEMVDRFCDVLNKHRSHEVSVNISGGDKLLGDAALFAAFKMGVSAYYVGDRAVRLPVIHGASAEALLTPLQRSVMVKLVDGATIDQLVAATGVRNRQAVERVIRELRKMDLATATLVLGAVHVSLTEQGRDLSKWIPECMVGCRAIGPEGEHGSVV